MRSTPSLRRWSIAAAVLLVLGGCLTVVGFRARSFGWFAYSPLSDESFEGVTGLLVVGRAEAVGRARPGARRSLRRDQDRPARRAAAPSRRNPGLIVTPTSGGRSRDCSPGRGTGGWFGVIRIDRGQARSGR